LPAKDGVELLKGQIHKPGIEIGGRVLRQLGYKADYFPTFF
jgi:hypothetical protein